MFVLCPKVCPKERVKCYLSFRYTVTVCLLGLFVLVKVAIDVYLSELQAFI